MVITTQSKLNKAEETVEQLTKQISDIQAKYASLMNDHLKLGKTYNDLLTSHTNVEKELHDTYDQLVEASRSWWSKLFS